MSELTPDPLAMTSDGRRCKKSMPAWRNEVQGGGAGRREAYCRTGTSEISPTTCKQIRPLDMVLGMERWTGSAFDRVGMEDGSWRPIKAEYSSEEASTHASREKLASTSKEGQGSGLHSFETCIQVGFLFLLQCAFQPFSIFSIFFWFAQE